MLLFSASHILLLGQLLVLLDPVWEASIYTFYEALVSVGV